MRCPNCDIEMNRHAEKPLKEGSKGSTVATIHCCPGCGKVEAEVEVEVQPPLQ